MHSLSGPSIIPFWFTVTDAFNAYEQSFEKGTRTEEREVNTANRENGRTDNKVRTVEKASDEFRNDTSVPMTLLYQRRCTLAPITARLAKEAYSPNVNK